MAGYLALGDSYSIGEGVAETERWPVLLAARLGWAPPQIIATTGFSTDELLRAMDAADLAPPYAQVSLLIGVNNQYRGRSLGNYHSELVVLQERALQLAAGVADAVFQVSIPDWGATPFATADGRGATQIGAEIDAFNDCAAGCCAERGIAFIDITPLSRELARSADGLVADRLHPSGRMYAAFAERAADTLSARRRR